MEFGKPGEGLPLKEKFGIKKILVPAVRVLLTWDITLFLLKREIRIIKNIVDKIDKQKCMQKVVIDRTFAIEDHSRQYSINMVLEHLCIAGKGIMIIIKTLSDEKEFPKDVTIEGVKPKENRINQIKEFMNFYKTYFEFIKNLPKRNSKMTKHHPWFESFNNYDWANFMYMHTFIHRRQIEAIIKEIK
ncbi:hypothetical protein CRV08_12070 [Halarcobacter ebronensis]|uniref:DinB-like domain-containing protein n=1 Tax=Halarcobacter ebronensis TaxID=1462615 RepID=A0A4Q0Y974_9BACT|nr:hypothetical protein [Halarcobacter ebronensis]RXJ66796.1 hypothetical protein CRV08_12070 [Halarcobacter ebronensis]